MRFIGNYSFLEPHNFIPDPHRCKEYCHNSSVNADNSKATGATAEEGEKLDDTLDGKDASTSNPLGFKNTLKSIIFPS